VIDFPKVKKISAGAVIGRKRIKKILATVLLSAGVAGFAVAGGSSISKASAPSGTNLSNPGQGAIVFLPAQPVNSTIAYHQSHRSHYSHYSHRSHYSHYSSRYN